MVGIWKKRSAAMTILSIVILLTVPIGLARAGPREQSPKSAEKTTPADAAATSSKSSHLVGKNGPRFKSFAISLDQTGNDQNMHLKTAVLVKPLRTDHFFVAFAASAPLIKQDGASKGGLHIADRPMDRGSGFQNFHNAQDPGLGTDWMVMTDWPQAFRLLPVDRDVHFNWMPDMGDTTGWHSKMELIFLPADLWTVRAVLSMAQDAPGHNPYLSTADAHSARVGMAIDVDYQIFKTIALGFDYGHYRYGRTFRAAASDADSSANPSNPDGPVRSDSFTARLTIRF